MATTTNITTGGAERVAQAADLYQQAFRDDPVIAYITGLDTQQRYAYLYEYFTRLNTAAALNAATFEEADDWASASVYLPPGKRIDNPWTLIPAGFFQVLWKLGIAGCNRMLREFEPAVTAMRRWELGDSTHFYYLFLIATRDDARGRGLSSALIRKLQQRAQQEDAPVWLEATSVGSARLYAKLGFKSVGKVILGEGVAAPDGSREQGGSGVPVDCMVWRPGKEELSKWWRGRACRRVLLYTSRVSMTNCYLEGDRCLRHGPVWYTARAALPVRLRWWPNDEEQLQDIRGVWTDCLQYAIDAWTLLYSSSMAHLRVICSSRRRARRQARLFTPCHVASLRPHRGASIPVSYQAAASHDSLWRPLDNTQPRDSAQSFEGATMRPRLLRPWTSTCMSGTLADFFAAQAAQHNSSLLVSVLLLTRRRTQRRRANGERVGVCLYRLHVWRHVWSILRPFMRPRLRLSVLPWGVRRNSSPTIAPTSMRKQPLSLPCKNDIQWLVNRQSIHGLDLRRSHSKLRSCSCAQNHTCIRKYRHAYQAALYFLY